MSASEVPPSGSAMQSKGADEEGATPDRDHWLIFNDEREVSGCHCDFVADLDSDCGWGDSVVQHLLAASSAEVDRKLRAARLALAAVREVREARKEGRP